MRLVCVGDSKVGKSLLIQRLSELRKQSRDHDDAAVGQLGGNVFEGDKVKNIELYGNLQ